MATRSGGMGVGWSNVLGGTWVGSTATVSDGTGAGDDSPVRSARLPDGDNEAEAFAQLQRLNGVSCRAGNNLDGVTVQTTTLLLGECYIGFHGSVGEFCFPHARREIDDVFRGVDAHPLQHIDQIGVDIDAV